MVMEVNFDSLGYVFDDTQNSNSLHRFTGSKIYYSEFSLSMFDQDVKRGGTLLSSTGGQGHPLK